MRFGVLNVLKFGVPLQISKRYRHFIAKTRGFETLRDLLAPEWTVKRLRAVSQLKNFDVVPHYNVLNGKRTVVSLRKKSGAN